MMSKLYTRLVLFPVLLLIFLISLVHIFSILVRARDFRIHETDSNTLVMKRNQHYDLLLSGASDARNFSRHKNHYRVEEILNLSIANIGQGAATCGPAASVLVYGLDVAFNPTQAVPLCTRMSTSSTTLLYHN